MGGFASLYIWGIGGERKAALKKKIISQVYLIYGLKEFSLLVFSIY